MAALQCEICGGKLVAKAGGLFECESCGMQYDKTRIQEMVQEIKGTVQVEGTVEVQGTVKLDNTDRIKSYLEMAEQAANGEAHEEAISYANKVLELDTKNVKALLIKASSLLWSSTLANQQFDAATELFAKALLNADDAADKNDLCINILNELRNAYSALLNLQLGMAEHATDMDDITACANKMMNIRKSNVAALDKIISAAEKVGIDTTFGGESLSDIGMGQVSLTKFKNILDKLTKEACDHIAIWKGSQNLGSVALDYIKTVAGMSIIIYTMQPEDKLKACDYMNSAESRLGTALRKAEFGTGPLGSIFGGIYDIRTGAQKEIDKENARKAAEEHRKQLEEHPETFYANAKAVMEQATTEDAYETAAKLFVEVRNYQDAGAMIEECHQKAKECRKNAVYEETVEKMTTAKTEAEYTDAAAQFDKLADWKDSKQKAEECRREAEEARIAAEVAAENAKKKRKKVLSIAIPVACACIAFVILLFTVIIPKQKFNKAMRMLDSSEYESAYALLEEIGNSDAFTSSKYDKAMALINSGDYEPAYILLNNLNYKDSETKLLEIKPNYQKVMRSKADIGSTVFFGSYEQDNDTSNGREDIEWRVLAKEDNKLLLISEKGLDCQQYNTSYAEVTWENCSLRKWMNGTFLNAAFTTEEQAQVQSTSVSADKNPKYNTNPGSATNDKVFLLSINEAEKYFKSDEARICDSTEYARAQGGFGFWWLRSPGDTKGYVAIIEQYGEVHYSGYGVDDGFVCVRPAMWISLDS